MNANQADAILHARAVSAQIEMEGMKQHNSQSTSQQYTMQDFNNIIVNNQIHHNAIAALFADVNE